MDRIVSFLIFSNLFLSAYTVFRVPFEFYFGYICYFFLPFLFAKYGAPKLPLMIWLPFFFIGVIYVELGLNSYQQLMKVGIGLLLAIVLFDYVVQMYNFDVKLLFTIYMKGGVIVSAIGIIQVVSYRLGLSPFYDYRWVFNKWGVVLAEDGIRMNSVFSEPSYFASTLGPAFFIALYNVINFKNPKFTTLRNSIIILAAYPLTKSGVAYIGISMAILLLLINSGFLRYSLFVAPFAYMGFNYAYTKVPEFRDRWNSTFEIYETGNVYSYDINGSSFVLYNHTHIATENFKENPIFGTGLGSHAFAFDRFSLTNMEGAVDIEFNKSDANSMALRLISETGITGTLLFAIFLFSKWIFKPRSADDEYWLVSNACFLIISLQLLRQGNYFYAGFPFFVWLYYYTAKVNKAARTPVEEINFKINAPAQA